MVVLAQQPTYREGINRLFTLFDMFRYSSKRDVVPGGTKTETHVRRAQLDTEELVASFAGRETFDQWKFNLSKLIDLFEDNPEWNQYLTELRTFILSTRSEEEVKSDQFKQQSKNLANRARELVQQLKDENDLVNFLTSSEELIENIKNDEYVKLLRHQAGTISSDLSFVDTEGNVHVDFDMLYILAKLDIQNEIEKVVEKSLTSEIIKLGDQLTQTLSQVNRPFLSGLETAKETLKKSEIAHVYANRREKLME